MPYEYRAVNLIKEGGEHHKSDYVALNPMREVPTLVIDGQTLTQSLEKSANFTLIQTRRLIQGRGRVLVAC